MKRFFAIVFALMLGATYAVAMPRMEADTTIHERVDMEQVGVAIYLPKQHYGLERQPISSSVATARILQREHIHSIKELSALMPNF